MVSCKVKEFDTLFDRQPGRRLTIHFGKRILKIRAFPDFCQFTQYLSGLNFGGLLGKKVAAAAQSRGG